MELEGDEVHVWRARSYQPPSLVQSLWRILSADERERAERFHFQRDRERFIVTRGFLRTILSRYLDVPPDQLCFCYSSYGKPTLAGESNRRALRFSLSHSHELALYAVTCGREVGIDIEYVHAKWGTVHVAERFFSPREVIILRSLPASMQTGGFFNCWTRKEAYVKARGEGLSFPLDQFDVSLVPGEPAVLVSTAGDPQEASRWSLRELYPAQGYAAALAVEGHGWQLVCWEWSPAV
jgi:4'-phosphopantetheinyl transferase